MAVIDSAGPLYQRTLRSGALNPLYEKLYLEIAIPNLSGALPSAAVLHLNCNTCAGAGVNGIISYISESASWDDSTTGADLLALSMLGASTASTDVTSIGGKTWDVLGSTNGILQCYIDGVSTVTFRIDGLTGTGNLTSSVYLRLGDATAIDFVYFDGIGVGTPPFLRVTYTPIASAPKSGTSVCGFTL